MTSDVANGGLVDLAAMRQLFRRRQGRRRVLGQLTQVVVTISGAGLVASCEYLSPAEPPATRVPRIGYLDPGTRESSAYDLGGFRDGLAELGYHTVELVDLYSEGDDQRLGALADELIALNPHVILAFGTDAISAVKERTGTVPIVMAASSDPVGTGLVSSLPQPGGNITGLTSIAPLLTGKRLQLLRQAFPHVTQVAYMLNPDARGDRTERRVIQNAYLQLGVAHLDPIEVTHSSQFQNAIEKAVAGGAQALITFASGLLNRNPQPIVEAATKYGLPAIYAQSTFVTQYGGLMAYGPDYRDMYRRSAVFVDKILRGHAPAELPVERPRRFTLLLNRTAVQAQGLTVSGSFLAQVDEVVY